MHFDRSRFTAELQAANETYTLREVADLTGVSVATLSRLERGTTPDLDTFFALCAWMNVVPDVFVAQSSTPNNATRNSTVVRLEQERATLSAHLEAVATERDELRRRVMELERRLLAVQERPNRTAPERLEDTLDYAERDIDR